jgi:diguanylate cyclase (GGDEF)-like protein
MPPSPPERTSLAGTLRAMLRAFDVYRATDTLSAEIRAQHLAAVLRQTPLTLGANVLNALLVCAAFWDRSTQVLLLAWCAALAGILGMGFVGWRRQRQQVKTTASPRAVRRMAIHAVILATVWAVVPVMLFPDGTREQQVLIGVVNTGMTCAGAFVMAALPMAAIGYTLVFTAAAVFALVAAGSPLYLVVAALLLVYAVVIIGGVLLTARLATARLLSEHEATSQSQIVALLLRDFEDQVADVLWETDAGLHFQNVTPKLAQLLASEAEAVVGTALPKWFEEHRPAHGAAAHGALREALAGAKSFRDRIVPVEIRGRERFWSIGARPLTAADGSVRGWRGVICDDTQKHRAQERLNRLAWFDSLTGLANRTQLRERLQQAIDACGASTTTRRSALLCLDVDNFKWINDSYGHAAGDAVLRAVAKKLSSLMRHSDLVARPGGDEFAVVIDDLRSDEELTALLRRLIVEMKVPCDIGGREVVLGVSVGVALMPDHGREVDGLLANADLALYAAKSEGKGRWELYVPALGERSRRQSVLEQELRHAVARGQLSVHWQPKVSVSGWRICGAEALLRWQHPTLGVVAPVEFIPVAEGAGLIVDIGAWVLNEACLQAARQLPDLTVSVNASPAQLMNADFVQTVEGALQRSGLPAERLEIEITESIFLGSATQALEQLHTLKSLGVRIALDDFGTGYSSLAYLRRFPFDTMKIDRSFVRELLDRDDARAIVKTIIDLARTLSIGTVAEGVEEPAQLELLQRVGCDVIQGYLVAESMPVADLVRLRRVWRTPAGRGAPGADVAAQCA